MLKTLLSKSKVEKIWWTLSQVILKNIVVVLISENKTVHCYFSNCIDNICSLNVRFVKFKFQSNFQLLKHTLDKNGTNGPAFLWQSFSKITLDITIWKFISEGVNQLTTLYSSFPNKRTCTPYLILTKLPPCTPLFGTASLSIFLNFSEFCQIFRPNLENFWEKLGVFSRVSLIINKIVSF